MTEKKNKDMEDNFHRRGRYITRLENDFPEKLRFLPDCPAGLYCLGKTLPEDLFSVAVVGARNCTSYGAEVAWKLGEVFAREGILLVSGMAKGIDGIAQRSCINAGGRTVAVTGCGIDICYPKENEALYQELIRKGTILTEYGPGTPPLAANFPKRNRIISGLSDVLVVVEAAFPRSGTMITARMAMEQGKEVYAVPGPVTSRMSEGTNRLIADGAGVVICAEDFLEEIRLLRSGKGK